MDFTTAPGGHLFSRVRHQAVAVLATGFVAIALLAAALAIGNTSEVSAQVPATEPALVLANGETISGLSGARGEMQMFALDVPGNATDLSFTITGGTGDADLLVRAGTLPTLSDNDCFLDFGGNEETCNLMVATEGLWFVGVRGYADFANVALTASYSLEGSDSGDGLDAGALERDQPVVGLSGSANQQINFHVDVPADAINVTFTMTGGTGDADLYVAPDVVPTSSEWLCRPWIAGNDEQCSMQPHDGPAHDGRWHVAVVGYGSFADVTLTATWDLAEAFPLVTVGQTMVDLAGLAGDMQVYAVDVPTGNVVAVLSGGWGDADVYVRQGAAPTLTEFDCFLDQGGNEETCSASGAPGRWYVAVRGYNNFGDVTLTVLAG